FSEDGKLFVTIGDRGHRPNAQDLGTHAGAILRLNPDGTAPADNPFVGRAGALPEIWSYGHRNPQGLALDPATGQLWSQEHGPRGGDEVNLIERGRNYGWPTITHGRNYDGTSITNETARPGMEQPKTYWVPSIAPSGLTVYRGNKFPLWNGNLFVGALRAQLLVRLEIDGQRVVHEERLLTDFGNRIRDVRTGPDGLIYLLLDEHNAAVWRLEPL
ncbi:MAG: PQQ-dependent sugar dehydrogenase, partial [Rhodospirillaceae bacterium]|nr:PQQ-dependent sugar dehydrogenase [Rhodospirillaceae bacterium]